MKKLFSSAILLYLSLTAPPVSSADISNYFTPYGFRTPLLERGQYALNFNPRYYRDEFQQDPTSDYLAETKWTESRYGFSLNGVYAVSGKLVAGADLILYPGQKRRTETDVLNDPYVGRIEIEMREHSHFTVSPGLQLSFRPQKSIQFYGDFHFDRERSYWENQDQERMGDSRWNDIRFNLGFTLLSQVAAGRSAPAPSQWIVGFLRPYGFRAPLINQGQYAVNFDCLYERTETSLDYVGSSSAPHKWVWRRYYMSLNGLYAASERLLFQGGLDLCPAQTRESYDREKMGTIGSYGKLRCDFAAFPRLVVALRPKVNMEFNGAFLFRKENLHKNIGSDSQSDLTDESYFADLGYTVLLKRSAGGSSPIPEAEFSNFLTPYRFRTPVLRQGQCALNANFHYRGAESEEHFGPGSSVEDNRSTLSLYYFSFHGLYAVRDELILECGLDVFPGQTRVTRWLGWPSRWPWHWVGGPESRERYSFTISPRLDVSFRPRANVEFYGAFYFNEEKAWLEDRDRERASDLKNENLYLEFGFTILGGL